MPSRIQNPSRSTVDNWICQPGAKTRIPTGKEKYSNSMTRCCTVYRITNDITARLRYPEPFYFAGWWRAARRRTEIHRYPVACRDPRRVRWIFCRIINSRHAEIVWNNSRGRITRNPSECATFPAALTNNNSLAEAARLENSAPRGGDPEESTSSRGNRMKTL